jgi:hypothetical protein
VRAPPPDFRYVALAVDHRSRLARAAMPAATAAIVTGAALHGGLVEAAWVGAASLASLDLARRFLRRGQPEATLAIVPWGVLLAENGDLRSLPWPAVSEVRVDVRHRKDEGTALATESTVIVRTPRETLRGTAPGSVELDSLVVNVARWADEACCPVASDLQGERALGIELAEPRFAELVTKAAEVSHALRGGASEVLPFGYRGASDADAWRASWQQLRAILRSREPSLADPRPLSALVAARIGAVACVPELLRLVSAPSAFLSLVAKAAALHLGAPIERAGSLEEVASFVSPEDLEAAEAFAAGA